MALGILLCTITTGCATHTSLTELQAFDQQQRRDEAALLWVNHKTTRVEKLVTGPKSPLPRYVNNRVTPLAIETSRLAIQVMQLSGRLEQVQGAMPSPNNKAHSGLRAQTGDSGRMSRVMNSGNAAANAE